MEESGKNHTLARWLNGASVEELVRTSSYRRHQVTQVPEGERQVLVRGTDKALSLFLTEEDRRNAFENQSILIAQGENYKQFCDRNFVRGDEMFTKAEELLKKDREAHRRFFASIVENGYVIPEAFNNIAQPYLRDKLRFVYAGDPYHLVLGFAPVSNCTFQEYIERHYIVDPCLRTADTLFEMMRTCPQCGDFFVAKAKKSVFCSPTCRVSYWRKHGKAG